MDILEELNALKADHTAALTLIDEAKASQDSLKAQLADALALVTTKEAALADSINAIAAKDADLKQALAEVASLKDAQKTAAEQAVELVASQGIKPLTVETEAQATSKQDHLAALNRITDPLERANYYAANRASIFDK